uniref:V-type proton ATPase subunit C n=1 Tax=Hirondellea gigas TaxID=1518452 RepID=A0A6A7GAK1_9CRUS
MTSLWIVAVPAPHGEDKEHAQLTRATQARNMSLNHEFSVPLDLKVGTLDSLISLCDDLAKMDAVVEGFAKKLNKTYSDLSMKDISRVQKFPSELQVDGKIPIKYIQEFKWNRAKFPINSHLKEIAQSITQSAGGVNKSLSERLQKLNEAQGALLSIERREGGSLMMRSLASLVDRKDVIEGEYITSVPVVVSINRRKEFEDSYETIETEKSKEDIAREEEELKAKENSRLEEYAKLEERALELKLEIPEIGKIKPKAPIQCSSVVPGSLKLLFKDDEYVLYRVVVMKKGLSSFASVCRNRRFNVRQFKLDEAAEVKDEVNQKEKLQSDVRSSLLSLLRWCQPQYSDIFASWIHLKAIRTFVESVLRFGLPVNFVAQFIQPLKGKEKSLRRTLGDLYRHLGGSKAAGADDNDVDFTGLAGEFYPYVFLNLPLGVET